MTIAPVTTRNEAALLALLAELAPSGGPWIADSQASLDGDELAVFTLAPAAPDHLAALLAYIWQGPMAGEWWEQTPLELIAGHLYVFTVDAAKSRRDDAPHAWSEAQTLLIGGTPIRRTNNAGAGTQGTRRLHGVGPVVLAWR